MSPDAAESARLALYCMEAENLGAVDMPSVAAQEGPQAAQAGPALPAWLAATHTLLGWVTGQDALLEGWLNLGARTVFYGWVMKAASETVIVIRGTESFAEWGIDATFLPTMPHPGAGEVESGFWSLYGTLRMRGLDGSEVPLAMSATGPVLVTGHSLGAPLATFLALELAQGGHAVRATLFGSPRPGDKVFADHFAAAVPDHAAYVYERDVVPRVPMGLGYCPVPNIISLPTSPRVKDNLLCAHHAGDYAWLIDHGSLALLPHPDPRCAACIYL